MSPDPLPRNGHYVSNREPLAPSALIQLPPGCISAKGWLATQLQLQIDGLTGHLDHLFEDVGPDSAWLGGNGEDWERGPYYLRGATALAYATSDPSMLAKIKPWIEWSLNSQTADGNFGPSQPTPKTAQGEGYAEWWPRMIMLQVMEMHHEATGDERVIPFLQRFFDYQSQELHVRPLKSWANWRGGDNTQSVYWLYNRTGNAALLDLARLLVEQTQDWAGHLLKDEPIQAHVVNLSQGYKQPGVWYQQCRDSRYRDAVLIGLEQIMKHHGRIDGLHCGDEAVGGLSSVRGSELCAATEFLHSMEVLLKIFGECSLADRIEQVAYNALPALIRPDWRGHQYFSQPNQVLCTREPHGFDTDHGDDLTFGVLTGYPCCATNMHMGWPKLAHHLWLATPDNGLAAAVYAPCEVTARVANGDDVTIIEDTDYPFREQIHFTIRSQRPTTFPLMLRIPGWCEDASLKINRETGPATPAGTFVRVCREWKNGDSVTLRLPMRIRLSDRENHSIGIQRGPLAYSLAVKEDWRPFPDWHRGDAVDEWPQWEVHAAAPWNYGLILDRDHPEDGLRLCESDAADQPFAPDTAPVRLTARARRIPQWTMGQHNNADAPPVSPVHSAEPVEEVTLLPFGATRLRISHIPTLAT